jgi:translation initiation factor 2 subunit 1
MVKRKGLPEVGDAVICTVTNITPYSATCKLNEYPNIEGMIHISEVSGRWVRDIRKFIKQGKQYAAKVIKVDDKTHVFLSLKRLSKRAKENKLQEYQKEKRAEKMLEIIAKQKKISLDEVYEEIGYELQEKYGDMFRAFEQAFKDPQLLVNRGIPKKWAELIHKIAKENIQKKKIKIKAKLELKFYSGDGIDRIKKTLKELSNKYKLNVKYISAPYYLVEIETDDPKRIQKQLREHLERFGSMIKDGEFSFKIEGEK